MSKKDKDFYVWTMAECIKNTYEWWGIDMMSMYDHIKKDFPNATKAIEKMHSNFNVSKFYEAQYLFFEKPQYVYEAIASFIPLYEQLRFDIRRKRNLLYMEILLHSKYLNTRRKHMYLSE